jgi:hypothetical protein
MRLKEAAEHIGVAPITLKRWLLEGLVPEVRRDRNGWRVFSPEDVQRIADFAAKGQEPNTSHLRPKVVSLFSGIGGFDLGFQGAGFSVAFQCEIEPFCSHILQKHWPEVVRASVPAHRAQSSSRRGRCGARPRHWPGAPSSSSRVRGRRWRARGQVPLRHLSSGSGVLLSRSRQDASHSQASCRRVWSARVGRFSELPQFAFIVHRRRPVLERYDAVTGGAVRTAESRPRIVVLGNDNEMLVDGFVVEDSDRSTLLRLVDVVTQVPGGTVFRRNRRLRVGRTTVRGTTFVVPPPLKVECFLSLVLYALGTEFGTGLREGSSNAGRDAPETTPDQFLQALAIVCTAESEMILRGHVARGYVERSERERVLRGRPVWGADFGRHPAQGLSCRTHALSADVLHNRLLLAGLIVARAILDGTRLVERVNNQIFIWRSLVEPKPVEANDFAVARARNTRLTQHYSRALAVAEILVRGSIGSNLFDDARGLVPHFEFSLPSLFERALVRMLAVLAAPYGVEVRFKESDRDALLNGDLSKPYRKVEPDITLWKRGVPIAVVDAKFKPRYFEADESGFVAADNRVSPEDLYQLFFYQARLQASFRLPAPPAAWIVAPDAKVGPGPSDRWRRIVWAGADDASPTGLTLDAVDLDALATAVQAGDFEQVARIAAPRFSDELVALFQQHGDAIDAQRNERGGFAAAVDLAPS